MKQGAADDERSEFLNVCLSIQVPQEFDRFFSLFPTCEERETMAFRYLITKDLLEGALIQREIAEKYKVSTAQIIQGSNALKIISPKFKKSPKEKLSRSSSVQTLKNDGAAEKRKKSIL